MLRLARTDAGITQTELGRRTGEYLERPWFPQAVSEAEKGRRSFTAEELFVLAIILDRPVVWFFMPPAGEHLDLSSGRSVPLTEAMDGPLRGGLDGNAAAALLDESMAIVNALEQVRVEMDKRASAVISVSKHLAQGDSVVLTVEPTKPKRRSKS